MELLITGIYAFQPKESTVGHKNHQTLLLVTGIARHGGQRVVCEITDLPFSFAINQHEWSAEEDAKLLDQINGAVPYESYEGAIVLDRKWIWAEPSMGGCVGTQRYAQYIVSDYGHRRRIYSPARPEYGIHAASGVLAEGFMGAGVHREVGRNSELCDFQTSWPLQLISAWKRRMHETPAWANHPSQPGYHAWSYVNQYQRVASRMAWLGPTLSLHIRASWKAFEPSRLSTEEASSRPYKIMSLQMGSYSDHAMEESSHHVPQMTQDPIRVISCILFETQGADRIVSETQQRARKAYESQKVNWKARQVAQARYAFAQTMDGQRVVPRVVRDRWQREAEQAQQVYPEETEPVAPWLQTADTTPRVMTFEGADEKTILLAFLKYIQQPQTDPDIICTTRDRQTFHYLFFRIRRILGVDYAHQMLCRFQSIWTREDMDVDRFVQNPLSLGRVLVNYTDLIRALNKTGLSPKLDEYTIEAASHHLKLYQGPIPTPEYYQFCANPAAMLWHLSPLERQKMCRMVTETETWLVAAMEQQCMSTLLLCAKSQIHATPLDQVSAQKNFLMGSSLLYVYTRLLGYMPVTMGSTGPFHTVELKHSSLRDYESYAAAADTSSSIAAEEPVLKKRMTLGGLIQRQKLVPTAAAQKRATDATAPVDTFLKAAHVGGMVQNAQRGVWTQIKTYDFSSMYPATMIEWGICMSGLVLHAYRDKLPAYLQAHPTYRCVYIPRGDGRTCYVLIQKPDAIIPYVERELLKLRKYYRQLSETAPTAMLRDLYDIFQKSAKIACNSLYGILTLLEKPLAAMICMIGRHNIGLVRCFIERDLKGVVPYGDTDSCFAKDPSTQAVAMVDEASCRAGLEQQWPTWQHEAQTISQRYFQLPTKVELERFFYRMILYDKKMYLAWATTGPKDRWTVLEKGLPHMKLDRCAFVRETAAQIILYLLMQDYDPILPILHLAIHRLAHNQIALKDLSVTQEIQAYYKNDHPKLHVEASRILTQQTGQVFLNGDRVRWIMPTGNEPVALRARPFLLASEDPQFHVDKMYILENQWFPPISKLLQFVPQYQSQKLLESLRGVLRRRNFASLMGPQP